ncbi:unnamed protein product [Pleuronectes platessa]|uniref:Uncharacterized protein n=1 Tax=Pleuronectes platessa TaxID=8262 RepID=A0A9N7V143_PLEPL|nr:unnamed protein product [Pleuronectes platessa]
MSYKLKCRSASSKLIPVQSWRRRSELAELTLTTIVNMTHGVFSTSDPDLQGRCSVRPPLQAKCGVRWRVVMAKKYLGYPLSAGSISEATATHRGAATST